MWLINGLIILRIVGFILANSEESLVYPQVPVCAPYSPVGTSHQASQIRGQKGDQGVPGKKGVDGLDGRDGMKGQTGSKGEIGSPGHPWGLGGCPGVTFHLPRDNQVTDYVRYRAYFPQMKEATVCMWLEGENFNNHATPMSYAVQQDANEWFIAFVSTGVRARVQGSSYDVANGGQHSGKQKLHICFWFSASTSQDALYINATRIGGRTNNGVGVRGGGDLILGQEQDAINAGGFDASQAFSGNITNFTIWPRILTDQEISDIARNCNCPVDYAVAMTLDKAELYGEAQYSRYEECPTL